MVQKNGPQRLPLLLETTGLILLKRKSSLQKRNGEEPLQILQARMTGRTLQEPQTNLLKKGAQHLRLPPETTGPNLLQPKPNLQKRNGVAPRRLAPLGPTTGHIHLDRSLNPQRKNGILLPLSTRTRAGGHHQPSANGRNWQRIILKLATVVPLVAVAGAAGVDVVAKEVDVVVREAVRGVVGAEAVEVIAAVKEVPEVVEAEVAAVPTGPNPQILSPWKMSGVRPRLVLLQLPMTGLLLPRLKPNLPRSNGMQRLQLIHPPTTGLQCLWLILPRTTGLILLPPKPRQRKRSGPLLQRPLQKRTKTKAGGLHQTRL